MASFLEKFFDPHTMSVHIREGVGVWAKKGQPGMWNLQEVRAKKVTATEAKKMIQDLLEEVKEQDNSFVEIDKRYSKVLQLGSYRIVIVVPPLSNKHEITVSRPLKKLHLEDYAISPALKTRFSQTSEGVLIAGRPGEGKSTLAQALIEFYAGQNKIVKTIEAPRDLQVPDIVTQYSLFHSSLSEIHDILLLSRPDYTFFDEVRNREDFELFKDLRLAGIGMVGVIHGSKPIDAIQRFVGKIELGMIPEIVDTLVFIEAGRIQKVYELELKVKVPAGMFEQDLARPVVVVSDFETGRPEYEMYTFGEEVVVLPLNGGQRSEGKHQRGDHAKHFAPPSDFSPEQEIFPRFIRDKKGFRFVFDQRIGDAVLVFEDGQVFSMSPNQNGYVKIGKKGKLPELLRRKKFKVYHNEV